MPGVTVMAVVHVVPAVRLMSTVTVVRLVSAVLIVRIFVPGAAFGRPRVPVRVVRVGLDLVVRGVFDMVSFSTVVVVTVRLLIRILGLVPTVVSVSGRVVGAVMVDVV
ncbi:hypothetical protein P1S61_03110 [Streptomyces sp. ME08-AFT2]|uniref:hypothetical protein n=1 Tax=Streptomyces sp. ME08-AFT2 TaxID=3028683 RepID=UPI0029B75336|nr:hypothetical protein [Streptomyces sp. ME08-AFT2]MDX3308110.1 hypothetical protein [Streptomyces sp. ME08-AFT2]